MFGASKVPRAAK